MPVNQQLLQANILKGHGRNLALHYFLQFKKNSQEEIKKWLKKTDITTAAGQLEGTNLFNEFKKTVDNVNSLTAKQQSQLDKFQQVPVCYIAFTATGLELIGRSPKNKLSDPAFLAGMKSRKKELSDPAPSKWEFSKEADQTISAIYIIACSDAATLNNRASAFENSLPASVTVLHKQKGEKLVNEHGIGIEHFGYADGVSQPDLLGEAKPGKHWSDVADAEEICVFPDPYVNDKDAFGSYFVFRKLDQNVKAFKEAEEELGFGELGGAYVVGRFEDGTPVTQHKEEFGIKSEKELTNDFNYDKDDAGSRCPWHAHIRMTNPRMNPANVPNIRIVRRGLPYDEDGRNGRLEYLPEGDVGLLFMCYQKSIVGQFEVIQGRWANKGDFDTRHVGIDGLIGQGANSNLQEYPREWNKEARVTRCDLKGFVTMRGGDYFYAPSITFFKNL
jgi:Dyp-type peroxidase family